MFCRVILLIQYQSCPQFSTIASQICPSPISVTYTTSLNITNSSHLPPITRRGRDGRWASVVRGGGGGEVRDVSIQRSVHARNRPNQVILVPDWLITSDHVT
eukprot:sb/3478336/